MGNHIPLLTGEGAGVEALDDPPEGGLGCFPPPLGLPLGGLVNFEPEGEGGELRTSAKTHQLKKKNFKQKKKKKLCIFYVKKNLSNSKQINTSLWLITDE